MNRLLRRLWLSFGALVAVGSAAFGQYTLTTLASFNGSNGSGPTSALVADANGNLFGTTYGGGASDSGTLFKIPAGSNTITTLISFDGTNGALPYGNLLADANGNLFGTTAAGGDYNQGTVFEIAAGSSTVTTLALFDGTNGSEPYGGLALDADGNLFGTTSGGAIYGGGTVFEIAAASNAITTLATFNDSNGYAPYAGLLIDAAGNLFGTTSSGGANEDGTVFEVLAGSHTLQTMVSFDDTTGTTPRAGLVADAAGNLYGTTSFGPGFGPNGGLGTVFELSADTLALTTMAVFDHASGESPLANLVLDAQGNLYGTTSPGSATGGTAFEVDAATHTLSTLALLNAAGGSLSALVALDGSLYGTTYQGGPDFAGTAFKLTPVPEPSSIVLGLFAATGLTIVAIRKHWARRTI